MGSWLKGGYVPKGLKRNIEFTLEKFGRKFLKEMYRMGISPHYVNRLRTMGITIGYSDTDKFKKFIKWSLKHKMFQTLITCQKFGNYNKEELTKSIETDKPYIYQNEN